MLFFWKKLRNKGSFLIEVVASVAVMSIGLVTVMQVYGAQRRLATINQKYTGDMMLLADNMGAVLTGIDIRSFYGHDDGWMEKSFSIHSKELMDDKEGLKEISLEIQDFSGRKKGMTLVTYVREGDAVSSF